MASRMERYYKADTVKAKRSQKNQDLYRNIYELGEYSNIAGVASIDKNNEIDITKVKKMLTNREDYKRQKKYQSFVSQDEQKKENKKELNNEFLLDNEEKTYDIRDVLNKAKDEKEETDDRYLRLDKNSYDILEKMKELKEKNTDSEEDLKDMIDTITNTSMLNKLEVKDSNFELLDDLVDHGTRVQDKTSIQKILEDDDYEEDTNPTMDNSFFTSSMKIKKEDFADEYSKVKAKRKKIQKEILTIIGLLILIIVVIVFIVKLVK